MGFYQELVLTRYLHFFTLFAIGAKFLPLNQQRVLL
jgi:hypothetical protein